MTAKMCVARSCIYYTLYFIVYPINQQVKFRGDIIPTALIRLNKSIDLEKKLQGLWSLQNVLEFVNDTIREKKSGSTLFNFKTYCISTFLRLSSAGIDFRTP